MNSFLRFSQSAEQIAATTKRLEKAAFVAEFLAPLGDEDLALASRYFAGQVFSTRDGRVVNIGGAAIMKAIDALTNHPFDEVRSVLVGLGDSGEVAYRVLPARDATLTVRDLADFFAGLS